MDFGQATGIPEGVHVVRLGDVKLDEWYWQDNAGHKGPRPGTAIVVATNPEWVWVYDIKIDAYLVAQVFDPPKTVRWKVQVNNSIELSDIIGLEKRIREEGGLVIESEIEDPSLVQEPNAQEPATEKRSRVVKSGKQK